MMIDSLNVLEQGWYTRSPAGSS